MSPITPCTISIGNHNNPSQYITTSTAIITPTARTQSITESSRQRSRNASPVVGMVVVSPVALSRTLAHADEGAHQIERANANGWPCRFMVLKKNQYDPCMTCRSHYLDDAPAL